MRTPNVKEVIRRKYGQAALGVESEAGCGGDRTSVLEASRGPITSNLYDATQKDELPDTAIKASLGCGNPTAHLLATVCDNAKESCPVFPGHAKRIHNAFEDPAALQGTEEERLALFRRVRNEIRGYLKTFPANAG